MNKDGILLVNKPSGLTSHDVVLKLRRILKEKKVGHSGTLDPLATGLLVIVLGKGTKIVSWLQGEDKEYWGVFKLGVSTDSGDASGKVVEENPLYPGSPWQVTKETLAEVAKSFRGEIEQVPPSVSAIKVSGKPLYKWARCGEKVEIPKRRVKIYAFKILGLKKGDFPLVTFKMRCSKGTYVRSLVRDFGAKIGCGAHLIALERRKVGPFDLKDALTLEEIETEAAQGKINSRIIPLREGLPRLGEIIVTPQSKNAILNGRPILLKNVLSWPKGALKDEVVKVVDTKGNLLSLARLRKEKRNFKEESSKIIVAEAVRVFS